MLATAEHAAEARLSIARSVRDVGDGHYLQGSNQAWHAAKHAINAVAASRNRNPVQYVQKRQFLTELAEELRDSDLEAWFSYPWQLHGNADQGFLTAQAVATSVEKTQLLVDRLLAIAGYL